MKTIVGSFLAILFVIDSGFAADPPDHPHPDVHEAVVGTVRATSSKLPAEHLRERPIGVFDSGTGGLTVLERILSVDEFGNGDGRPGADGRLDFERESFVFLADQANMPYGNYPVVGKGQVLDDLIVKDAQFLLGKTFHTSGKSPVVDDRKSPVKVLVIACNTATAYGQVDIERAIADAGADIKVIGVIDAGAEGALELFRDGKPGTIGVVPTKGTVLSGAYPAAIRRIAKSKGIEQRIDVVQQGAYGLAGAIDGAAEFIEPGVVDHTIRAAYRGPSMTSKQARIDLKLLPRYGFDFTENRMLYAGEHDDPKELQLNSVENYVRYHLVTLLETVRASKDPQPLRALVMGCTHFPYFKETFREELARLYDLELDGAHVYRDVMAKEVELIDPAVFTARALYASLRDDEKLRKRDDAKPGATRSEFYITIPCRSCVGVETDDSGAFPYDYKYGRSAGRVQNDYLTVPLRKGVIGPDGEKRLRDRVPHVWRTLDEFRRDNAKLETKP